MDNSISARADNIWVRFFWDGEDSYITIRDDGCGMLEEALANAMRLGSMSPQDPRNPRDLGRFGLGMKTASFSQCRRLIVRSRQKASSTCTRCWDLDYVSGTREWRLLKAIGESSEARLSEFDGQPHGTIVLWEHLDRLVSGNHIENRTQQDHFYLRADQVVEHISMVFHRFLEQPGQHLTCWVNGRRVEPWNPFLRREPATQRLPEENLLVNGHLTRVAPFVLPHQSRLEDSVFARAAGSRGWNDMQGFYVYRNDRMVVAGEWLGLGFQKEEHSKLARIEVNIPSAMDLDWQIDVKKSRARPPAALRDDLKRIAKLTLSTAREVYRSRGKVLARSANAEIVPLWQVLRRNGKNTLMLNRKHPAIALVKQCWPDGRGDLIDSLLRLIEETLPVSSHDVAKRNQGGEPAEQAGKGVVQTAPSEIIELSRVFYTLFQQRGKTQEDALRVIASMEPFCQYPELLACLQDDGGIE